MEVKLGDMFAGFNSNDPDDYTKFASPSEVSELDQLTAAFKDFLKHINAKNPCDCGWCKLTPWIIEQDAFDIKTKRTQVSEDEMKHTPRACGGKEFLDYWMRFRVLKKKAEERGWEGSTLP